MQPLLLLHGALGSKKQFKTLQEELSKDYNVYALDFHGHGGREAEGEFSIATFAQNVLSFLESQNIDKINIFGYSMGGYVALHLALHHPEKIDRILTLGTKLAWSEEGAEQMIKFFNPEKIAEKVPAFAKQLDTLHQPNDWKEVMNRTSQLMLDLGKDHLENQDFQQIDHNIRVCLGSEDTMVTQIESEEAVKHLKNSDFYKIEGWEHPIEKINTKALESILKSFF